MNTPGARGPAISFAHQGAPVTLAPGESFHRLKPGGFSDASDGTMRDLIAAIHAGKPWRSEIEMRFGAAKPWLRDVILSPKRTAFFPLLPAAPSSVLDIGCGWGQLTLPLARAGHDVLALEPGPHRLSFVEAAAAQDELTKRIRFVGADFMDCTFGPVFDVVLCVGVLEWVGAFSTSADPQEVQRQFLRRVRATLAPGGMLVVGIENRIGAKYLLGCPDDHLGVPGFGCLPAAIARRRWREHTGHELRAFTYSADELRGLLLEAGFASAEFHAAFPDYKLPERVLSVGPDGAAVNDLLRSGAPAREHNGFDGSALSDEFHERLDAFYRDTARAGCAHTFAPSFFVVGR